MILREIKNMYIKNRLTEGVDYKRYEWLCTQVQGEASNGGGYAGQQLNIGNVESYGYTINYDNIPLSKSNRYTLVLSSTWTSNSLSKLIRVKYPNKVYLSYGGSSVNEIYNFGDNLTKPLNVYVDKTKIVINDITYSTENNSIFMVLSNSARCPSNGKYSNIKVNGNAFFPCKLLQDIPAHLDSSGIARSVNECGLIGADGKFYGKTSSSTGTFTVEGEVEPETHTGLQQIYQNKLIEGVDYETADWLRSTGGAQIGLNYTNNGNFNIELKGKELQTTGTDVSQILGTTFTWNSSYLKIAIRKLTGNLMFENNSNVYSSAYQEFELKVINSSDSNYTNIIINGDTYTPLTKKYPLKLARLFYWYNGRVTQHTEGCIGHLKVDKYCNMYPCKLLRPIPRNLDAQCKERVAGECGMIDLISGKFYGNVASSGTFTVENDNNE